MNPCPAACAVSVSECEPIRDRPSADTDLFRPRGWMTAYAAKRPFNGTYLAGTLGGARTLANVVET